LKRYPVAFALAEVLAGKLMKKRLATLQDVAEGAGVSKSTASRALRDSDLISETTRERVRQSAERLGYRMHPLWGRVLNQYRNGQTTGTMASLAILNYRPDPHDWHRKRFYSRILQGVRERAGAMRFGLDEIFLDDPGVDRDRLDTILEARGIRGLIIPPVPSPTLEIAVDWDRYVAVSFGLQLRQPRLDRAVPDHHANLRLAWEQLRQAGYRRIGLALYGGLDDRIENGLTEAFHTCQSRDAVADEGIPPYLRSTFHPPEFDRWLERHRPDALLVMQNRFLEHLAGARREERAGGPLPVDLNLHPNRRPGACGIDQNLEEVGSAGIDLLATRLFFNETGLPNPPVSAVVEGHWSGHLPAPQDPA
jgi:LacI family transcriptional regulator